MQDRQALPLRIGAVAEATGLTPDAVRYYERLGLLRKPVRTGGRFRLYSTDTISRLRFIKQAQGLGLALKEIRELLAPPAGGTRGQCERMRALLARHLNDVEARLQELAAFRRTLRAALDDCDRALRRNENIACPVVEHLEKSE